MSKLSEKPSGILYVVATPIGNQKDFSARAGEVLGHVDVIAAEDTRRIRRLLSSIAPHTRVIAYHEHNEDQRMQGLLKQLSDGQSIALVSDAGTPLISDPGWSLVRAALDDGIQVSSIAGPSAVTAALSVSGLPSDRFVFEGFLSRRKGQRATQLKSMASESRTMIFFESVHRLRDFIAALSAQFGSARPATIIRELTKTHESIYRGSLSELEQQLDGEIPLLGEFVVIVAGASKPETADAAELRRIFDLLNAVLSPQQALSLCADITGVPRNTIYRLTRLEN